MTSLCSLSDLHCLEVLECKETGAIQASRKGRGDRQPHGSDVHALQRSAGAAQHRACVLPADVRVVRGHAVHPHGSAGAAGVGHRVGRWCPGLRADC